MLAEHNSRADDGSTHSLAQRYGCRLRIFGRAQVLMSKGDVGRPLGVIVIPCGVFFPRRSQLLKSAQACRCRVDEPVPRPGLVCGFAHRLRGLLQVGHSRSDSLEAPALRRGSAPPFCGLQGRAMGMPWGCHGDTMGACTSLPA